MGLAAADICSHLTDTVYTGFSVRQSKYDFHAVVLLPDFDEHGQN